MRRPDPLCRAFFCLLACVGAGACIERSSHPELAPAADSQVAEDWRLAGEFEPVDEVFLGWDDALAPFFRDALYALVGHARVSVVVDGSFDRHLVEEIIEELSWSGQGEGAAPVRIIDVEVESVWLRDFGPLVTRHEDKKRVTELEYWAQGADDQLAARLARSHLGLESTSVPLELEGGNIQVDGTGNCLLSTSVLAANPRYSEAEIRDTLREAFGCSRIEILPPLPGEPTNHVDMFLTITGPKQAIVGKYAPGADPAARHYLDFLSLYLQDRGFLIRRVPMPDQSDGRYRTYTNSLVVNGVVLVPSYGDNSETLQDALQVYREAYQGREIVPIDSSALIELSGSVHCTAMTTPL